MSLCYHRFLENDFKIRIIAKCVFFWTCVKKHEVVNDLDINTKKSMENIHFGNFSEIVNDETIKLLEKINNHPKIQDYMKMVSTDVKSIMVLYTEYVMGIRYKKNNKTNYIMALKNSLEICTSENGSVLAYDVDAVFTNGKPH